MATTLYLQSTPATTHRATNTAKLAGATSGWNSRALATTRGAGVTASAATATVTGATAGIEVTDGTVPYEWLSEPVAADVTITGTITANIWASESSMSANVAIDVVIDIVRSDSSNTIVQIVKSTFATELNLTTRTANNFTTGMTSGGYSAQTLNRGDRLRFRVFGDDAGAMVTGFTFDASWAGASAAADGDSYITFTENITFESAPNVISQDSGTSDIGIGSAVAQTKLAQSFKAIGSVNTVTLLLYAVGSPADTVQIALQADSAGVPSGTDLVSDSIAASSLTTSSSGASYTFNLPYATVAGTTYWIVAGRSGAIDGVNIPMWKSTAAAVDPYLGGNGFTWNGATWTDSTRDRRFTVTGPTTVIYLTDTASDVATASVDREAWTSRGGGVQTDVTNTAAGFTTPIQVTDTAGGTVVDWFTKQLQAVTLTGLAQANIRALESNASANASIRMEIASVASDGTSPTVWGSWCMSANNTRTGELNTTETAETANVSGDDLAITDGQRLRIRLYIDDMPTTAMGASQTVTTYYAGTSAAASGDTYVTFPVTLTEYVPAGTTVIPVGFAVGRDY